MAKEEKSKVRESKPLAESPKYDMDASILSENLKKIQADSDARRAAAYAERKAAYAERKAASDKRRASMSSKGKQSSGSLSGLNTSLGGKIVK